MNLNEKDTPSQTATKPQKKWRFIPTLILISMSILFALVLIEAICFFVPNIVPPRIRASFMWRGPEHYPPGTISDPELGYVYAPGLNGYPMPIEDRSYQISTVNLGQNNIGFVDDGLNGEPFAVVIGDSYTSCVGVNSEECWVELLENGIDRDFANMGVFGYSAQQERRMLAKYGLPLQPKLVLWSFFANDLIESWYFDQVGIGGIRQGKVWDHPITSWLANYSAIYGIWTYFWYNRSFFSQLQSSDPTVAGDPALAWWLAYGDLSSPEVAKGFELVQEAILAAKTETEATLEESEFVVVIFPSREQRRYQNSAYQTILDGPNNALVAFCRKHNIPVIDLTKSFKTQPMDNTLYYKHDSHLTKQGNQLVAHELIQQIESFLNP